MSINNYLFYPIRTSVTVSLLFIFNGTCANRHCSKRVEWWLDVDDGDDGDDGGGVHKLMAHWHFGISVEGDVDCL